MGYAKKDESLQSELLPQYLYDDSHLGVDHGDDLKMEAISWEDNQEYKLDFTEDQIAEQKNDLVELSIKIEEKEADLKELISLHRKEIKRLKEERKLTLNQLKEGKYSAKGTVYLIHDEVNRLIGSYNSAGILVGIRKAGKGGIQTKIKQL